MKVKLPEITNKSDRFKYLRENKDQLIAQKKSTPHTADEFIFGGWPVTKSNELVNEDVDVLRVKTVANTANWCDSHNDVLLVDCWKKSIDERKAFIPHLHDHKHEVGAKVGEVNDIYGQTMTYEQLGITGYGTGQTQSLIFDTDVIKSYNPQVFNQYKLGKINQHSIGLWYVKIALAINDPDDLQYYEIWEKYFDLIINKEKAEKDGFFWPVAEIKLIENSAVLFGSNEVTPTLDNNVKSIIEPSSTFSESRVKNDTLALFYNKLIK